MNSNEMNLEIYKEELHLEEDCGMFYILDMNGNVIAEFDNELDAKEYLDKLKGIAKFDIYEDL